MAPNERQRVWNHCTAPALLREIPQFNRRGRDIRRSRSRDAAMDAATARPRSRDPSIRGDLLLTRQFAGATGIRIPAGQGGLSYRIVRRLRERTLREITRRAQRMQIGQPISDCGRAQLNLSSPRRPRPIVGFRHRFRLRLVEG